MYNFYNPHLYTHCKPTGLLSLTKLWVPAIGGELLCLFPSPPPPRTGSATVLQNLSWRAILQEALTSST